MSIDERARHQLHEAARSALGAEAGDTLMALLPPVGWADVATKADLAINRELTKRDIEAAVAALRSELRDELKGDIGGMTARVHGLELEMVKLRADMAESQRRLAMQLVGTMVTVNGLFAGLVMAFG